MAKCICCNAEIDDSKMEYIGVIERYHYDDRHDTAAIDHGPTKYKPVALIHVGMCPDCEKQENKNAAFSGLKMLLGGAAALIVAVIIAAIRSSNGESGIGEFAGIVGLIGIICILVSLGGLISTAIGRVKGTNAYTSALSDKLQPEWVIWPETDKPISVKKIEGSLSNRHQFSYSFIFEKKLKEPDNGKNHEGSYSYSLNRLRNIAKDRHLFSD